MSGRLGDLSGEQERALGELRGRIGDVATERCDDQYLLRFLRARQFDVDKAEKKIRATLEFRKKYGADTILQDWTPPPLCSQFFPGGFLPGTDRTGHPVTVLSFGQLDLKGLIKCHTKQELIKTKVFMMERLEQRFKQLTEESGKVVDTVTAIVDLFGLSSYHLWRPGLQLFSEFMQIEEMHYPEIVNRGFLVRTPRIFPTIYAIIKPFIDPNTREKLEVLGGSFKDRLLEHIPDANLPEVYGGKLKHAPDVCWAGKVPKENYKENDDSLQHQYVKPGKTFSIEVEATKTGVELTWEFVTENHDIGFCVYWLNQGGEKQEMVPAERVSAHLGNIEGSIICEATGTYILEFDNTFSWTKGKNLKYKYDLIEASAAGPSE